MKKILFLAGTVIAVVAVALTLLPHAKSKAPLNNAQGAKPSSDIVSNDGIHWHPQLAIYIKSQRQEIPANIGVGKQYAGSKWYDPMMNMTDFHTHDNKGNLHWEVMEGPVTKEHVQLKAFFEVWGKAFNSTQIFDSKNSPEGTVKMTVNGQPNNEFELYQVKDKDVIEIRYE